MIAFDGLVEPVFSVDKGLCEWIEPMSLFGSKKRRRNTDLAYGSSGKAEHVLVPADLVVERFESHSPWWSEREIIEISTKQSKSG
jgi:hypothetical protein